MKDKKFMIDLPMISSTIDFYETCILGKMNQHFLKDKATKAT